MIERIGSQIVRCFSWEDRSRRDRGPARSERTDEDHLRNACSAPRWDNSFAMPRFRQHPNEKHSPPGRRRRGPAGDYLLHVRCRGDCETARRLIAHIAINLSVSRRHSEMAANLPVRCSRAALRTGRGVRLQLLTRRRFLCPPRRRPWPSKVRPTWELTQVRQRSTVTIRNHT